MTMKLTLLMMMRKKKVKKKMNKMMEINLMTRTWKQIKKTWMMMMKTIETKRRITMEIKRMKMMVWEQYGRMIKNLQRRSSKMVMNKKIIKRIRSLIG